MFPLLTLCAVCIESLFGYPGRLFSAIGHPVTWMGRWIALLDRRLNRQASVPASRMAGLIALVLIVALPVTMTMAARTVLHAALPEPVCLLIEAMAASTLIAQRSLYTHVRAVWTALRSAGLEGGRRAVSQIVGRDPETLDEAGVIRAAIESLAENFSDGVVAPVFWLAVLGLPGIVAYKAINTADSMIGHLTPRHADFGRAAALCDDCVNIPASRLTALLLILAAFLCRYSAPGAIRSVWRDARRHRSPNAGWPEAAMAGALVLRLAGPRHYGGVVVPDSWMGCGRSEARPEDLAGALVLYRLACVILGACLLGLLIGMRA
ncbi:adenosylcobinamide-phosphate synthase CbiB [Swaminathania salitolerans]|uniref:Cobalamin biosynthesis protein CobD n=1 Tax=Swaminathania salitolerans TaxID=182838 RepID=A0A511BX27_9PROT|nr:adenosylcobinamide-phosphate synthase CbiB [Swaminathania salitolerans]GBQ11613.1 cobalamin biosynthesis protein CobD/CbiB [Swaminathania salitolerans LMG 21291]GEL02558.1 cobalamin biosynthesis protein CobD [Swaminathania salitolerans]